MNAHVNSGLTPPKLLSGSFFTLTTERRGGEDLSAFTTPPPEAPRMATGKLARTTMAPDGVLGVGGNGGGGIVPCVNGRLFGVLWMG